MEITVGDVLPCEDQLKTTLHCDDKEKLRRKLALLQREYLKTAQRLQRAERSEAVRRHVRSRIEEENNQEQRDSEVTSSPCVNPASVALNTTDGTVPGLPQCQENCGADSETRRSQVIRFLLPSDSDAAFPQTPDHKHDTARGHRPSPALSLRSRRSRLRLERRSAAEAGRSADNSEEGREQSEKMATPGGEVAVKTEEEAEVVNESEELFSTAESESPSLLLTHWNSGGQTEKVEDKETQRVQEQREKETKEGKKSISVLNKCQTPALHPDKGGKGGRQNGKNRGREREEQSEVSGKKRDGKLCEDSSNKKTEQTAQETKERERRLQNTLEIKEEKGDLAVKEPDVKAVSLLDSCTLVEGLLFPAEYYVRTTRRMSSSQSQPNMEAVIHTQLSMRRPRRSRGRGRGQNKDTHNHEESHKHPQTEALSSPLGPSMESSSAGTPAELHSQSSCEVPDQAVSAEALFTPKAAAARPARGRRGRRGRGRGRGRAQTPRCSLSLETNEKQIPDDIHLTISPASAPASLHGDGEPKLCLTHTQAAPEPDLPEPVTILSSAKLPPGSGGNGAQSDSPSGGHEKVHPVFLMSGSTTRPTQEERGTASWQSLLLPSPPPAQTSLLPLPSLSSGPLMNHLLNLDYPQDFHLPDDQFASLKLHKLRRVSAESGVEHFTSPSSNTCSSIQHPDAPHSPVMLHPTPLSLTPEITDSSHPAGVKQAAARTGDLEDLLIQQPAVQDNLKEQKTDGQTHTRPTETASVVQDSSDQHKEKETVIINTHRPVDSPLKPQPSLHLADSPAGNVNANVLMQSVELQIPQPQLISLQEPTHRPGFAQNLEGQKFPDHQTKTEDKDVIRTLSFDSPRQNTLEEPSRNLTKSNQSPAQNLNVNSPVQHSKESPKRTTSPPRDLRVDTQLLLSPLLASAPGRFTTPGLPPSLLDSSLTLPFLGPTPCPVPSAPPMTSSPSAPVLCLPPPHSPSTQKLSPPPLSPCMAHIFFPPSQPQSSSGAPSELPQRVPPAACPPVSSVQDQVGVRIEETAGEHTLRCLHTLKAPAGGCLVDACCLTEPSGGLCVAAAGKWAVCLWSLTAASDWSLTHTWAFNEPVINVFPVPDAAGLLCVTLGQLEIREVRMLSCSSLSQVLLCDGLFQAVVGVSGSRVVTSSHSAPGSTLQVFRLSESSSTPSSQPLVSPGVCVGALAAVDGLTDALIGTDESGRLFVWNLKTGQLLKRITLTDGLSHTACLRGYSYCGVLFVLLQHHLLSSLEEEEREAKEKDQTCPEDEEKRKKSALFSLVAVNPLTGRSVLATQLYPPKAWSGRLCEADVSSSSVVGLSQSGCACVWQLERRGASTMMWATESEGWQLARWGGGGTLVTGLLNGDVSLHRYSSSQTTLLN
ncbi:partner and localizer of BRCA2 isoform X2 [Notolabrus celidotus]|uniref:partner and localizer of BRCA2 isoform X2 n=1 Tax=Notolabrus celidotus TaxID=1203425 RepID=UPI00149035E8|nr:partner and localizer of BRCA2 isoform X2 [Notolabrus celidotus]